jgi:hypothetical protein
MVGGVEALADGEPQVLLPSPTGVWLAENPV